MVAVINNFGGFYNRELYFRELQKTGAVIKAPCINNSDYYTRITGNTVYTGFIHIEGLEIKWMEQVLEERKQYGPYTSLEDFAARIVPPPEQLDILIRIGAFNFDTHTKKELLWKSSLLLKSKAPHAEHIQPLFQEQIPDCQLPMLSYHEHEHAFEEIALLGFPLCSPFDILQHEQSSYIPASDFKAHKDKIISTLGYLVCTKGIHTSKGIPMSFGTFMDVNGHYIDTVHFPEILRKYPFQKGGFYMLQGKVTEEYDVYTIEVNYMRKIGYFEDK